MRVNRCADDIMSGCHILSVRKPHRHGGMLENLYLRVIQTRGVFFPTLLLNLLKLYVEALRHKDYDHSE